MAVIRLAGTRDSERVFSLMNTNLDDYFAPEVINYFQMQWPNGQLVADDFTGRTVGAICGARLDGGRASIALFAVDSDHRHSGVGSQLLDHFKTRCMMEGMSLIQLEVRTTNKGAIRFYEMRGFTITEHLHSFYNDGGDGYRMVCSPRGTIISS